MIESMLMDRYLEEGLEESSLKLIMQDPFLQTFHMKIYFDRLNRGEATVNIARDLNVSLQDVLTMEKFFMRYLSEIIEEHLKRKSQEQIPSMSSFGR